MKFDVIMMDGNHTRNAITADIMNYKPFLHNGGFVLLHDIAIFNSVKLVFNELKKNENYKTTSYISKSRKPCGIGMLQYLPGLTGSKKS